MVNISVSHGMSGACAHGYVLFGFILGPVFHRYHDGHRFAKLACDLTEKHGFIAVKTRIYLEMGMVAPWTQPLTSAIEPKLAAFRTATDTGDLTFACYSLSQTIADLLVRNDPLDAVWRECERSLDFVRKANFRDVADVIVSQRLFIAAMQGRTPGSSTFSDQQFDETRFEDQLTGRMPVMNYIYWALKLKARYLLGHYTEAHAAAEKAKGLLWAAAAQIHLLDYYFYAALTMAALYETASTARNYATGPTTTHQLSPIRTR
jgi:predicted ATPase